MIAGRNVMPHTFLDSWHCLTQYATLKQIMNQPKTYTVRNVFIVFHVPPAPTKPFTEKGTKQAQVKDMPPENT
jgi:hypothetical protein